MDIFRLDNVRFDKWSVFCGAGISKKSGLPLANELKQYILETLSLEKENINELMTANIPFEVFMETISENVDIYTLLDIFQNGEPNTNHILIAKLAKHGYVKTIFTTNFDLLLEAALEREGLRSGKDFQVYFNERQFEKIDFEDMKDDIISVLKIHGSICDIESIRLTMKSVANKTLSEKRRNAIRYLFSNGNHKKVLILGYSCSDAFDIIPQIECIDNNHKEVLLIEHSKEGEVIEDIKLKEVNNPFRNFPGNRVKVDTDCFVVELWHCVNQIIGEYKPVESQFEWKRYVDNWSKDLDKLGKHFVSGSIFVKISHFTKAIEYYEKSLKLAKVTEDKVGVLLCYMNLGNAYGVLGDFKKTIEFNEKSLAIAKALEDKKRQSLSYNNLGIAYYSLGDFDQAIEFHEKSLELATSIRDMDRELSCYINLGNIYDDLGQFEKAINYYEKALEIAITIGNKGEEEACYVGFGNAYLGLSDFNRAIDNSYKALEIAKVIGDREGESRCYIGLGNAYLGLGDFKSSVEYCKKALETSRTIGDREAEGISYATLGGAYYNLKDFHKVIEHLLKAEEIFVEMRQTHYVSEIYRNLALAYKKIGDNGTAEHYRKKLNSLSKVV